MSDDLAPIFHSAQKHYQYNSATYFLNNGIVGHAFYERIETL